MKYQNIKAAKLSHAQIAKAFGYASVNSFRCSSAHQRHMRGIDAILEHIVKMRRGKSNSEIIKAEEKFNRSFSQAVGKMTFEKIDRQK